MNSSLIFNEAVKANQRARSAQTLPQASYVYEQAAAQIAEILEHDIVHPFEKVLIIGDRFGFVSKAIKHLPRIGDITATELSSKYSHNEANRFIVSSDNDITQFEPSSFDLVISSLNLHWVNDLQPLLFQYRQLLTERGLFLGTMLGGDTLCELRTACIEAETKIFNGISPRVSPFTTIKDAGRLLQSTGYHLPVSHGELLIAEYDDARDLMQDLRSMGESNALLNRKPSLATRKFLNEIDRHYPKKKGKDSIEATFEVIHIAGWKS